jgi:hypothetical protein
MAGMPHAVVETHQDLLDVFAMLAMVPALRKMVLTGGFTPIRTTPPGCLIPMR